jgi:phosphatidylserine decarboxylase
MRLPDAVVSTPMNPATTHGLPGLFASNEHLVCGFESLKCSPFVIALVGVTIVAARPQCGTVWSTLIAPTLVR